MDNRIVNKLDILLWILWFFDRCHHKADRLLRYFGNGSVFQVARLSERAVCRYRLVCHDFHDHLESHVDSHLENDSGNSLDNSDNGYKDYFEAVHMDQDASDPVHDLGFERVYLDK